MSFEKSIIPSETLINNRTLFMVRWMALGGQLCALLATNFVLGISIPLIQTISIVVLGAGANIISYWRFGWSVRQRNAALHLGFDMVQIVALLYFTGGLHNPFCIMALVPISVAASLLSVRYIIALLSLYIVGITALHFFYIPFEWPGSDKSLPTLFVFGEWLALIISGIFLSIYIGRTSRDSAMVSLALRDAQTKLGEQREMSAVGALAAAAAHELGSPLSTITLVANDLKDIVPAKNKEVQDDLDTLISQSRRCSEILHNLSSKRRHETPDMLEVMPIKILLELTAAPYLKIKPSVSLVINEELNAPLEVRQTSELSYGLGNLIQNAVQFASSTVHISISEKQNHVEIKIRDDGPGFSDSVLSRLGQPYFSTRTRQEGHMGLGVFIARTLLEKTGAEIAFENNLQKGGAQIIVKWLRKDIAAH